MVVNRLDVETNARGIYSKIYDIAWFEPLLPENCQIDNYKQRGNNSNNGYTIITFNKKDRSRVHNIISSFNMDSFASYETDNDPDLMYVRLSSRGGATILYNRDLVSAKRIMPFSKRKILRILPQCLKEFYTINKVEYNPSNIKLYENYMNVSFKILCKNLDTAKWLLDNWYSVFNRRGGDYIHVSRCLSDTIEYLDTTECVVTGILLHKEPNYKNIRPIGSKVIKGIRGLNTFLK